jgi:hypothetical protein
MLADYLGDLVAMELNRCRYGLLAIMCAGIRLPIYSTLAGDIARPM